MAKHTEASMIELLHERYGTRSQGNGQRYVAMSHVRSDAGFDAQRTADFMALDLWPSKGLILHGHEVKISRSDWLNELKDPEKAGAFIPHVDYWWLVIADKAMVKDGELPANWGMMAIGTDGKLRVIKQAPRLRELVPLPDDTRRSYGLRGYVYPPIQRGLAAAMLRAAAKTSKIAEMKESALARQQWRDTHTVAAQRHVVQVYDRDASGSRVLFESDDLEAAETFLAEAKKTMLFPWIDSEITYTYTETAHIR